MLFETVTVADGTAFGVAIQTATWDDAEERHLSIVRQMERDLIQQGGGSE